ncbi:hypothetical protein [Silvibacterium dinghuense]|uniref:Uncharacterized protein n=1 Tax=Silvibacterium dinghuense TaxID=1560006 RepID=A0A4Q1S8H4_9BACT|nr:hypothetical protein [Silvibacterium dinghuense]RXS93282.1 hypothetical protein ESZ00_18135 [Silvibacterium dinghuense]
MLLAMGQPQAALGEYRVSLRLSPNRFNGLAHAADAAEKSGDHQDAGQYYAALVQSAGQASSARPELAEARRYLEHSSVAAK